MGQEKYFIINGRNLYLEQVFVEFEGQPIYFLCFDGDMRYLCLCTDIESENYMVVQTDIQNIINMLRGKITMHDALLKADTFWKIQVGEEVSEDIVEKYDIREVDTSFLPQKDAYFHLVTKDMTDFCQGLEKNLYDGSWEKVNITMNWYDETYDTVCEAVEASEDYMVERMTEIYKMALQLADQHENVKLDRDGFSREENVTYHVELTNIFEEKYERVVAESSIENEAA